MHACTGHVRLNPARFEHGADSISPVCGCVKDQRQQRDDQQ
jgi:hypothetical protein